MSINDGQDYLSLSGIQHFIFCPRQWALIHIEQQWEENILTFYGQELHKKTNDPFVVEKRKDKIIARAVPVVSHELKIYGIADVVEFNRSDKGMKISGRSGLWWPLPVEYKLGKPKRDDSDIMQLCAQAVCLEEMFKIKIDRGCIYYGKTRRRLEIQFDDNLRAKLAENIKKMYEIFNTRSTPAAKYSSVCENCSLNKLCVPKLSSTKSVTDYLKQAISSY